MAINPNTTFTAGAILTAAQMNRLPYGVMAYAETSTAQGSITSTTDLTSLTATWTAIAGRTYLIQAFATAYSSVGNDPIGLIIATSGNTAITTVSTISQSNLYGWGLNAFAKVSPSAGSVTYKLRSFRPGTGTLTYQPDATTKSFILVTDLGPA